MLPEHQEHKQPRQLEIRDLKKTFLPEKNFEDARRKILKNGFRDVNRGEERPLRLKGSESRSSLSLTFVKISVRRPRKLREEKKNKKERLLGSKRTDEKKTQRKKRADAAEDDMTCITMLRKSHSENLAGISPVDDCCNPLGMPPRKTNPERHESCLQSKANKKTTAPLQGGSRLSVPIRMVTTTKEPTFKCPFPSTTSEINGMFFFKTSAYKLRTKNLAKTNSVGYLQKNLEEKKKKRTTQK